MKTIGNRIEELMNQKGIRKTDLANEIGLSQPAISKYINDKSIPSATVIGRLAAYFEVTSDYIIFGTNEFADQIEEELIKCFRELTHENRLKVVKEATGLRAVQRLEE